MQWALVVMRWIRDCLVNRVMWYNRHMTRKYEMPSVGDKFGELSVRKITGRQVDLDCSCGGQVVNINIGNLMNEKKPVRRCKECSQKKVGEGNRVYGKQVPRRRIWGSYRASAKKRGIPLTISFDSFIYYLEGSCVYCGKTGLSYANPNKGEDWIDKYTYTGIDRVNPNLGYEEGNIQSCCKVCNYAKLEMNDDEFYEWMNGVVKLHPEKFVKSID